jgi:two-component SAPR family response regulator
MGGSELADDVMRRWPNIKLMFMSGYADDSVVRHGALDSRIPFLQKPFTPDSLSRKVRKVLDQTLAT